jgi:tRNA-(ms[2]io[6]A)-hydroxylase
MVGTMDRTDLVLTIPGPEDLPQDPLDELPLLVPTSPRWIEVAGADPDALLIDHAHCELKAAANAMSMAGRYAEETELVTDLVALAREELRHFAQVHAQIRKRGLRLTPPATDRYVRRLSRHIRHGVPRPVVLLDQLLVCGFIEARSCERFRLLAQAPIAPDLRAFYGELGEAESRHHELFFRHAAAVAGRAATEARVRELAELEAALVHELPIEPRMH